MRPGYRPGALEWMRPHVVKSRKPLTMANLKALLPGQREAMEGIKNRVKPEDSSSEMQADRTASKRARRLMSRVVLYDDPSEALRALHQSVPDGRGWRSFNFKRSLDEQIRRHLERKRRGERHEVPDDFREEFESL